MLKSEEQLQQMREKEKEHEREREQERERHKSLLEFALPSQPPKVDQEKEARLLVLEQENFQLNSTIAELRADLEENRNETKDLEEARKTQSSSQQRWVRGKRRGKRRGKQNGHLRTLPPF